MDLLESQKESAAEFGNEPLLVHPSGQTLDLVTGYIPLLTTFTHEDKAAKGVRKGKTVHVHDAPLHFSALELVRDNRILVLSGPVGSGKTTFAKHLCFRLATNTLPYSTCIIRNEAGRSVEEDWNTAGFLPCFFPIQDAKALQDAIENMIPELLSCQAVNRHAGLIIVIDAVEKAGDQAVELINTLASQFTANNEANNHLLVMAESRAATNYVLPSVMTRHSLLPLLAAQRRHKISQLTQTNPELVDSALGEAAQNPAIFALAFQIRDPGRRPERVWDAWLTTAIRGQRHIEAMEQRSIAQLRLDIDSKKHPVNGESHERYWLSSTKKVRHLLAARHISTLPHQQMVDLFRLNPVATTDVLRSVLIRLQDTVEFSNLAKSLLQGSDICAQRAALVVGEFDDLPAQLREQLSRQALKLIEGNSPISDRLAAGGILSRHGDSRNLNALAFVPAGSFVMGSRTHPNSEPVHEVHTPSFSIGIYPVTVRDYLRFVLETDRNWVSPDRYDFTKENVPATDLTWYDAILYCGWLTERWREAGKIGDHEQVRLPTEPEWERAASGVQNRYDLEECFYPWATEWRGDQYHANTEETGLNQPCTVGLFPNGKSTYGCHDMAGNVWEWCTTLWGEDMADPSFKYPWQDDGRENEDAPETIRRVLRGGCFSSGKLKANSTYRGSLEPNGHWRGNGFRIVVSQRRSGTEMPEK